MRSDQLTYRPVVSTRRYLDVALQILEGIGSGTTPLGSRLPADRELASLMNVSRPTVREAVLALEVVGVLQVRPGDGTYVVHDGTHNSQLRGLLAARALPLSATEVLEARACVEPSAVALAAQRATAEQLAELEKSLDTAERLMTDVGNLGEFVSTGLRFHAQLSRLCGNSHLSVYLETLVDIEEHPLWTLLNAQAMQSLKARKGQVAEHREIVEAIRDHDGALAALLMTQHIGHLATEVEDMGSAPTGADEPETD